METAKDLTSKNEIAEYFLDNFGFGAFRIDTEGNVKYVNSKLLNMLGFDFDYQFYEKLQDNSDFGKNVSVKKYFNYIDNNLSAPIENRWFKNNGQTILLREFIKPVRNKNSNIVWFDCIVEDITERHIIENLFQDIKTWNYSLLKALPDPIFIVTRNGEVVDFQGISQSIFGDSKKVVGNFIGQVFGDSTAGEILKQLNLTFNDGGLRTLDIEMEVENSLKFFEARFVICNPEHAIMVLRDTSQRKQAELELKETSERLRILNNTKDRFMSIIAHDLRTPINGLLGYSEILTGDIEELTREEIKDYTTSIAEIALSANRLLTNILEWSRIQCGNITLTPSTVNIHSITERVFNLLLANATNKKITLQNNVAADTGASIDENMFEIIMLNMVSNAIKFTNVGGLIEIEAATKNDFLEVSVKDNGVGMTKESLNKIFDSEHLFTTQGTQKEKGTGLGLLLCKEFVERHGGVIRVESEQNKGTHFYFTLRNQL